MLAIFCLRLATGMIAALSLLPLGQLNPRFLRTHLLTALGLVASASVFLREVADAWLWTGLAVSIIVCFVGSIVWAMEGAPGGRVVIVLATVALIATLLQAGACVH